MKIRIKRRRQNEIITFYIFIAPFFFAMLTELLHLPSAVKYTVDAAWLFLLLTMLLKNKPPLSREARIMKIWIIAFFVYCLIDYAAHFQSAFYFLWGLRNNFRFYVFFLACVYYLNGDSVQDLFGFVNKMYCVHLAVFFVQFFFLGRSQDTIGGIFGTEYGCNGWLNIFHVIVVTYSLVQYLHKECSVGKCIFNCGMALVVAAIAELKFFYAEFVIILILAILLTDFTWKKVGIIVCAILGFAVSVKMLLVLFPEWSNYMSVRGFLAIASSDRGYTSSGDMNRLTFMGMSNRMFLKTPLQRVFGLGLGNCDFADGFSFLTTSFYKQNSWTHYTWLSLAHMYLENGLVGLVFYLGFFVLSLITTFRYAKSTHINRSYLILAEITAVMCIAISIYNASLRVECGYMLYFVLAIPHILGKENSEWKLRAN